MTPRQRTIAGTVEVEGHGLHTGEAVRATLRPAGEGQGIVFRRVDLPGDPEVPGALEAVRGVEWETALGAGDTTVRTVEHVLAALHALAVDNVRIDLDGPEIPAFDGSARRWCDCISEAGVVAQDAPARRLSVRAPIHVECGDARYDVVPYAGYRVSSGIEFEHELIGRQFASVEIEPGRFRDELAGARTFGMAKWGDDLRARGLALGASTANTLVLREDGLEEGVTLRYPDEFVRHKILDLVGDLALVGARLECHVVAERPGHKGNIAVARRLKERLDGTHAGGLDIRKILEYLPHRYPMLLVDRVLEFEEGHRILGLKNVTINEPFFEGHFPGHPIMPGVLIVEALAQCGGLLLMNEIDDPSDKVVYFMSLDGVKFRRPVRPGDQLHLEVELVHLRRNICKMRGHARVDGRVAAEGTMMAQIVDR